MATFWLLVVLGTLSMLFGTAVLILPDTSIRVLGILLGIWLMLIGAARVVAAFTSGRGFGRRALSGIVGTVLFVSGVACVTDIAKGAAVLAFLVALAWIVSGLATIVLAFQEPGATRVLLCTLGVVSIGVGLVFVASPRLSLVSLVIMVGLSGLVIGVSEFIFAFQIRRFVLSQRSAARRAASPPLA